ncbi:hypothetical protein AU381_18670 [Sinorhizobium glycinis]|uniref:DUF1236 domain-containing protein n=1 Tax=Sinorhizobium glycinis TaxID=1472378 RepID=A0A178XPP3_9HYPH|nr:DUF1236 domain-containing protein [Sinorhizobium glycinis]OAP36525.1 hypothetical protein AU381_18670 [Sinorhizobium glycinis]
MKGILIKSALALSLGVPFGPAFAQTEQPAQGQSTECPAGTECPQGGAAQGQQPDAQGGAAQQDGEATGKGQQDQTTGEQPETEQGGTEQQQQPKADTQQQQQQGETKQQGTETETEQQPAQDQTEQQPSQEGGEQQQDQGQSQQTQEGQASGDVNVTVEQKTEITQIIKEEKVEPIDVDFDVSVGVAVPETVKVKLRPLPPRIIKIVPRYEGYLFFILADGRIVIVEPSSLKIVVILA